MARPGVTREDVFGAAEALVLEGQAPTVVAVRTKLEGGSPNTIAPFLSEWKQANASTRTESFPPLPETVETAMRQVWGAAWKEAQEQLEGEREALTTVRKEIDKERTEMLGEITRLDGDLENARNENKRLLDALDHEHQEQEQTKAKVRELQAVADERSKRIDAQEKELQDVRREGAEVSGRASRLEAEIKHTREDLGSARESAAEAERKLALSVREVDGLKRDLADEMEGKERAEADLHEAQARASELQEGNRVMAAENERLQKELESLRRQLGEEKRIIDAGGKKVADLEMQLGELRVETATYKERAEHVDELRKLLGQLKPVSSSRKKPAAKSTVNAAEAGKVAQS